ncbi:vWA domain-containing protein [Acinetobacter lanii]|uniref:Tellurium resistance protein n=1 Tax=Acinetobacter lanii TaxID=2715163 RepID=A0A6G8S4X1_9GAMM|nr:VWA domain-containing protein [Acinetobacter lanii]QIO09276.1 tellurium resistance protein [Acinetobacter lanii]
MKLVSGQKIVLSQLIQQHTQFTLRVVFQAPFEVDISSFALNAQGKLFHDDYMTFYNQPITPKQEVKYTTHDHQHLFEFDLKNINVDQTPRFVICATVDHAQLGMKNIQHAKVELMNQEGQELASYSLDASHFQHEKAVMLTEIYFKNEAWRISAVGQGFNGGLKALVKHFGGEVAEDSVDSTHLTQENLSAQLHTVAAQQQPLENLATLDLRKKIVLDKVEKAAPHLIDLTKKSLLSLEKNNLLNVKARVALVLDYSGSMTSQYKKGDVQKVLDRVMPLALNFDDDGCFECWAFAEKALRLSDVKLNNLSNYIETEQGGYKKWKAGAGYNNEPAVLEAVINYFIKQHPSNLPVYVVFISDGGVSEARKIKKIMQEASLQPIFWQFVGIGGRNYGVLEKLDNMEGRIVDNCNFFEIEHIESISDSTLYDQLLQEFPQWLNEAKNKNILRG